MLASLTNDRSPVVVTLRVVVLLAALFAEVWNNVNLVHSGEPLTEHYAYFTIHSNLLVIVLVAWMLSGARRPGWFDGFRAAVTAYIVLAGLVWALLLATPEDLWGWNTEFTNFAQHRLIPVLMALDWLLVPTARALRVGRQIAITMLYPIAYLACSWLRGAIDGWFPYPFLDPAVHGGWAGLVWPTGQVLVAFIVGITVIVAAGRVRWAMFRARTRE